MATFGALQTKVSKKLIDANNTAIAASDVADAINDALHFWKYQRFWFNEAQVAITMDVNDPFILGYGNSNATYPNAPKLPQYFLYEFPEDGFVINYNNLSYTMAKKAPKLYDAMNVTGMGVPAIYTFRNGNYEFYFYPNIAYTMNVYYIRDYPDLVNQQDVNDFTNYAGLLLVYEALSRLIGEQRQDLDMAAAYEKKARREYENLKARGFQQTESGELTFETIL